MHVNRQSGGLRFVHSPLSGRDDFHRRRNESLWGDVSDNLDFRPGESTNFRAHQPFNDDAISYHTDTEAGLNVERGEEASWLTPAYDTEDYHTDPDAGTDLPIWGSCKVKDLEAMGRYHWQRC